MMRSLFAIETLTRIEGGVVQLTGRPAPDAVRDGRMMLGWIRAVAREIPRGHAIRTRFAHQLRDLRRAGNRAYSCSA